MAGLPFAILQSLLHVLGSITGPRFCTAFGSLTFENENFSYFLIECQVISKGGLRWGNFWKLIKPENIAEAMNLKNIRTKYKVKPRISKKT